MTEREKIRNKFGNKCYLCGQLLGEKFHVDHLLPIHRTKKYHYDEYFNRTEEKLITHPERDTFENKMPACISCNILKSTNDLETFRDNIKHFLVSLNRDSTQYKTAKRYNLVKETEEKVVFYFEKS